MKKLEEIIAKEKSFLIAAGITLGARALDMMSTSVIISRKVDYVYHKMRVGKESWEYSLSEAHHLINSYAATFEATPFTRKCIEEYGLNQGLFLHDLVVTAPTLTLAYVLNKMYHQHKIGNTLLYCISGISVMIGIHNLYQW